MLLNCFLLAICVSIDSLSIGLTYGFKNTNITVSAKFILCIIAVVVTLLSTLIGNSMSNILSPHISNIIGCILLCVMGLWIIMQSVTNKKEKVKKEYHFFIKFLGITIQIIRNPIFSDLNNSNQIEAREAMYLGIALSLDSIGIGIGSSILGLNSFLFSILVAIFELSFLSLGSFIGQKIKNISNIPQNIWSIIAGTLLIFVGISKIVFSLIFMLIDVILITLKNMFLGKRGYYGSTKIKSSDITYKRKSWFNFNYVLKFSRSY